jgi:hypothetical protein
MDLLVGAGERRIHGSSLELVVDGSDHGVGSADGHEETNSQHHNVEGPFCLSPKRLLSAMTEIEKPKMHRDDNLKSAQNTQRLSLDLPPLEHMRWRRSTQSDCRRKGLPRK